MVSLVKVSDLDAIADLNVEAYREFAVRMSPEGWRDMEAEQRKGVGSLYLRHHFPPRAGPACSEPLHPSPPTLLGYLR